MQKKATITTIIITIFIFLGAIAGIYLYSTSVYNTNVSKLESEIEAKQNEVEALKAAKDTNGFTATDVVKLFFNEVKSESNEKAKLYLAPEIQDMDIQATLKLGSDLSNVTTGEYAEETENENVSVSMTFMLAEYDTTVRVFKLSKYDGVWKIVGVTAE